MYVVHMGVVRTISRLIHRIGQGISYKVGVFTVGIDA